MKTLLTLMAIVLLACSFQAFGVETDASPQISNQGTSTSLDSDTQLTSDPFALPSFMLPLETGLLLPDCPTIEGTSCSGPGVARCYDYQYQEPMICICQANNTFVCF